MNVPAVNLPGHLPVVFWDFDGVFNVAGESGNQRKKHAKLLPGHMRKRTVYVDDPKVGGWLPLQWSAELTRKLTTLKTENPYLWVWLTTWVDHTHHLDESLQVKSDATVAWTSFPNQRLSLEQLSQYRNRTKLTAVRDFHTKNPHTPFVWVDDEATLLWKDEYLTTSVPHLVLTPASSFGVSLKELDTLTEFLKGL